jgi:hypothetical protein
MWIGDVVGLVVLAGVVALLMQAGRAARVTLAVDGQTLSVVLGSWDALFCLQRRLVLPLSGIEGVAVASKRVVPRTGLRLPGTGLPGVIRAGSYGTGARRDFWDVRRGDTYLVLELAPGSAYRRVVLEVPDPHAEALRLRLAVGSYAGTFSA